MRILLVVLAALPLFAGDFENFTDNSLNYTQRNTACFALRGNKTPETIAAMRQALDNSNLQACAGANLRVAGAAPELLNALEQDKDPTARAVAARELGTLQKPEYLAPIRRAAEDRDVLAASNAIEGLMRYEDHSPGLDQLEVLKHDPEVAAIGRTLIARKDPGDQLIGIRAVGIAGDVSDLPRLRQMEKDDTMMGSGSRGFGLMPAVSISHAARTAIENIGQREGK